MEEEVESQNFHVLFTSWRGALIYIFHISSLFSIMEGRPHTLFSRYQTSFFLHDKSEILLLEAAVRKCFLKEVFLKIIHRKKPVLESLFNNVAGLNFIKKRL